MKPTAALVAASLLGLAAPAAAADFHGAGEGWKHHHRHPAYHHHKHHRHHHGHVWAEQAVEVVEYLQPCLPRGVLYNAPPIPVAYGYRYRGGYGDVISAKY